MTTRIFMDVDQEDFAASCDGETYVTSLSPVLGVTSRHSVGSLRDSGFWTEVGIAEFCERAKDYEEFSEFISAILK